MKLKKVEIRNFKGCPALAFNINEDVTNILGPNASGKTTAYDAILWNLFDKNSQWATKFGVRTLDRNGNLVNNTEIYVGLTIEDNSGTEHLLEKTQKQNWVTKRGSTEAELKGNLNTFMIDGFPKSEREFKEFISSIAPEEQFKICSSVTYAPSLPWKDLRKMLTDMVKSVTDAELAEKFGGFPSIVDDLSKGSVDDCQKKYAIAVKGLKKQQTELPTRVDEVRRSLSTVDVEPLRQRVEEIDAQLTAFQEEASKNNYSEIGQRWNEINTLNREIQKLRNAAMTEYDERKEEVMSAVLYAVMEVNNAEAFVKSMESQVSYANDRKAQNERLLKDLTDKWNALKSAQFDEATAAEGKCPTCGRKVTAKMIDKARAEFISRNDTARNEVYAQGKRAKDTIKAAETDIAKYEASLKSAREKLETAKAKLAKAEKAKSKFQTKVNIPDPKGVKEREEKIATLRGEVEELESVKPVDHSTEISALRREKESVLREIASADNTAREQRIKALEDEQMDVEAKLALLLRQQDELMRFIQQKMDYIAGEINSHFKTVRWKLFDKQINGGISEVCTATVNGVPYNDLNSGHRILAGLEIARVFQKVYGFECPVFIDNAESLSQKNIPHGGGQLIMLSVAEGKLRVE